MKREKSRERGPELTMKNIEVLEELMTGKYLRRSITDKVRRSAMKQLGYNPQTTLEKLERMGIVIGYIPMLSEEGQRLVAAMKALSNRKQNGGSDALIDLVEE